MIKFCTKNRSKSPFKNKNLSFEKFGQKPGQGEKSCRATHTSPKMRTCSEKSGWMVTLAVRNVRKFTKFLCYECNVKFGDICDDFE